MRIAGQYYLKKKASKSVRSEQSADLLYDSECPICMMEVRFLEKRDIDGKIRFTDLNHLAIYQQNMAMLNLMMV